MSRDPGGNSSSGILTARRVTSSLSRAHQSLGASVLVAETAAGRLREDGEVIQVGRQALTNFCQQ